MNIVALISDFGYESFYVGVMKAAVHHAAPAVQVVDITHGVSPYAVEEGSFILARAFEYFKADTVFLAVVDPGVGGSRKNLAFRINERYLIAPDNGLVSDVAASYGVESCVCIEEEKLRPYRLHEGIGKIFLGRDIFAPAAGAVAGGAPLTSLGKRVDKFVTFDIPPVNVQTNRIEGNGRFIDHFGNLLTNITRAHLDQAFGTDPPEHLRVRVGARAIEGIREYYNEESRGTLMAILGSWDLLEISVNQGRAADELSITDPRELPVVLEI